MRAPLLRQLARALHEPGFAAGLPAGAPVPLPGLVLSLLLAVATLGCDPPSPPPALARDSAGIRIVESRASLWGPDEAWQVSPEPLLSIGVVDGPAELSFVRIGDVHRLDAGALAVIDGGSNQIRFFSPEGRFLRAVGRRGAGPGEFQSPPISELRCDSLWLFDAALNRLTVLDTRTDSFRVANLEVQNLALGLAGLLADGSIVLAADLMYGVSPDDSLPQGSHRFGAAYVRVSPTGETLDTVLIGSGSERILRYGAQTIEMLRPLFARSASHTVAGDRMFHGDQEVYRIRAYQPDGRVTLELRRTDVDLTLSAEVYRSAVERRVDAAPEPARPGLRVMYAGQPIPNTRPAYGRFLTDPADHLWVEDYPADDAPPTWGVFAPDGRWLGTVGLPGRFRPLRILGDQILGVWTDPLGVEFVRIHHLDRR